MELKPLVPSEMNPPLNRTLVTDERGLSLLQSFLGRTVEFGYDLETNIAPNFVGRKIRTMQFGNRNEQYVVDMLAFAGTTERLMQQGWRKAPDWAKPVIDVVGPKLASNDALKVGVNLNFEYITTAWCLGIDIWHLWCCQEAERQFYQGKVAYFTKDFWGMEPMLARYTGLKINKELQKSFDLETPLTEDQIDYAALDTRLPLAIKVGQIKTAEKLKVGRVINIEQNAIPAFAEMHLNGFKLNETKWRALITTIEAEHVQNLEALDTFFLPVAGPIVAPEPDLVGLEEAWRSTDTNFKDPDERLKARTLRAERLNALRAARREIAKFEKDKQSYTGKAAINYGSPDQMLATLQKFAGFKTLKGTSKKVLARFSDKPVVQAIQAFRKSEHALKSFGLNWLEYINPETGRIHANHQQNGTETGRPSCSSPNLYNLPKEKRYRSCFTADEGFAIITVDESGAELRIIAELSGEQSWIDAFAHNMDMHSVIACDMQRDKWNASKGVDCKFEHDKSKCECPEHKVMRDGAKAVNFGVAYGKEAAALAEDLKISIEAAKELLSIWRKANSKVQKMLTDNGNSAKMNLASRTFSGRIRFFDQPTWEVAKQRAIEDAEHFKRPFNGKDINKKYGMMFSSIEREGKNTPIQGGNADITKTAMGCGHDKEGKPFMWHLLKDYDFTTPEGVVKKARIINHVYDEVVVSCPVETANACMEMIGDCFTRAGAEFMTKVAMTWDGHVADCWTK